MEAVQPERSQSRHPLFQVVLVLQNAPEAKLELPGLNISEQELAETIAKFDLTFSVNEQVSETGEAQGLRGYIEYSADLFDGATVEELGARLVRLLRAAVAAPEARLHELEIVTEEERRQLLNEFNLKAEQPVAAAATTTLVELFEAQVERTPAATALSFGQQRLSYAELNSQANRVAHYLMAKGNRAGIAGRDCAGAHVGDGSGDHRGVEDGSGVCAFGSGVSESAAGTDAGRCAACGGYHVDEAG